jgi:hypothetical protein
LPRLYPAPVIVFGTAIGNRAKYEAYALPGIERVAEPDSLILTREGYDSIQQPYNEMMDEAAALPELEGLVLLHDDLELIDNPLPRIRELFRDPRVGSVGVAGARGIEFHLVPSSTNLFGRMDLRILDEAKAKVQILERFSVGSFEVEGVDGVMLALAPWVVRSIRFGEALADCFHGYDADIAQRIRVAGGRVICDDIEHVHYMSPGIRKDSDASYRRSARTLSAAWDPERQPHEWAPAFHR